MKEITEVFEKEKEVNKVLSEFNSDKKKIKKLNKIWIKNNSGDKSIIDNEDASLESFFQIFKDDDKIIIRYFNDDFNYENEVSSFSEAKKELINYIDNIDFIFSNFFN